jgi:hypothetical protein
MQIGGGRPAAAASRRFGLFGAKLIAFLALVRSRGARVNLVKLAGADRVRRSSVSWPAQMDTTARSRQLDGQSARTSAIGRTAAKMQDAGRRRAVRLVELGPMGEFDGELIQVFNSVHLFVHPSASARLMRFVIDGRPRGERGRECPPGGHGGGSLLAPTSRAGATRMARRRRPPLSAAPAGPKAAPATTTTHPAPASQPASYLV